MRGGEVNNVDPIAILKLLVALARLLGIDAVTFTAMFNDDAGNQKYYDELLYIIGKTPNGLVA